VQKEYNGLSEKVVKLHHDLEEAVHHNSQLLADNGARQVGAAPQARGRGAGAGPLPWFAALCVTPRDGARGGRAGQTRNVDRRRPWAGRDPGARGRDRGDPL
jgi:hypothetical protein